jgi:hypothetical protein
MLPLTGLCLRVLVPALASVHGRPGLCPPSWRALSRAPSSWPRIRESPSLYNDKSASEEKPLIVYELARSTLPSSRVPSEQLMKKAGYPGT